MCDYDDDDGHPCHLRTISSYCHDSDDGNDDEEKDYVDVDDSHSS